jgi:S-DNA-T family DNA segregation ATPase FtsK/SpoIIIE
MPRSSRAPARRTAHRPGRPAGLGGRRTAGRGGRPAPLPWREPLELVGVAVLVYLMVDMAHPAGGVGREVHRLLGWAIGQAAWPWLAACLWAIVRPLVGLAPLSRARRAGWLLLTAWTSPFLSLLHPAWGGRLGQAILMGLQGPLGPGVAVPALFLWLAVGLYLVYAVSLLRVAVGIFARLSRAAAGWAQAMAPGERPSSSPSAPDSQPSQDALAVSPSPEPEPEPAMADGLPTAAPPPLSLPSTQMAAQEETPSLATHPTVRTLPGGQLALEVGSEEERRAHTPATGFRPAPLSLLERGPGQAPLRSGAKGRRQRLEEVLRSFGVEVRVVEVLQGPAVTRFEVQPAPGVKVSRILALQDDIALALAAPRVRMEAPIPGKSAVGIEVPNGEVAPVRLRDILESSAYRAEPSPLAVGLGMDVAGAPIVAALDRMPHLLIAGATGSGKSVCINVILTSLLCRATPREVRLLLIDPKVVELGQYDGIPHLLAPVVTDPRQAAGALMWAVREMEQRYRRFAQAGARDLVRYNALELEEPLPFYVVVIDELADLMMVAPREVEDAIARLAQMARAAGIHLVVATQRPSVDVITGLIKANIPSRIAFAVSSQVDSRTILDSAGAEKLLGRGDMLFSPMGAPKPIRAQGALVTEGELEAVLAYVREQQTPSYAEDLLQVDGLDAQGRGEGEAGEEDALFREAVRVVVEAGGASTSLLQRRLRIGYARAGRLLDALADRGIVGPPEGSKPREVRLTREEARRRYGLEIPPPAGREDSR